jgi:recombination protein RecA
MSKISTTEFTTQFFKSNKDYHYNLEESAEDYIVSSGSMILDSFLSGGFSAGVHRFVGANEGGKTNEALHVMFNMFNTIKNSKGLFIKAEGRLSKDVQERSGLKFVFNPEEWVAGTCLVFECNVFDVVFDLLRGLLRNNPEKEKFCIVIDSMDGLLPKAELDKTTSDAAKVAAGALMTSDFLKRVSIGMAKFGHMCILISQVRSRIDVNPYAKGDPNNQTNSSGGNAALHYPDWILEFQKQNKADKILEKPNQQITPENKIYGHMAKVLICKSTNETTGQTVKYPIKHGRTGGKSIWIEREIVEMLMMWGFLEKSGSWFSVDDEVISYLKERNIEMKERFQGMAAVYEHLEQDEAATLALKEFVKEKILQ